MRRTENAVIFSSSGHDKEKVSYCDDCLKVKILSPLRNRLYLDENGNITSPAPDSKSWKQCWTCGLIVPIFEVKIEAGLDAITESRKNPFKNENEIVTEESRKFRTGNTYKKKKFKQDLEQYKEEDIKQALKKGQNLISYHES